MNKLTSHKLIAYNGKMIRLVQYFEKPFDKSNLNLVNVNNDKS